MLDTTRARIRFARAHVVALCLGLLAALLLVVSLLGCGSSDTAATDTTPRPAPTAPGRDGTARTSHPVPSSPHATHRSGPGRTRGADPASGLPTVAADSLPQQARRTLDLIDAGGPYPYPRNDGVVYRNRNGVLPRHPGGYYHEYTVATPGAHSRGARRIVTGDRGEFYYTADHYDTFSRIIR